MATASATPSTSTRPFLMVVQHPVTTEADNRAHLDATLRAIAAVGVPAIWFWPNVDAGTGEMADGWRHSRACAARLTAHIRFITNVPADEFVALLNARGLRGRQLVGRHQGVFVSRNAGGQHRRAPAGPAARGARDARRLRRDRDSAPPSKRSSRHGRYPSSTIYHQPETSQRIVDVLASTELYTQKRFHDHAVGANVGNAHESAGCHHGPRRLQGHSRQEPQPARGPAAASPTRSMRRANRPRSIG